MDHKQQPLEGEVGLFSKVCLPLPHLASLERKTNHFRVSVVRPGVSLLC